MSFICVPGTEKISVSKSDVLNVSAVASACERSYKTGLPVQLSLSSDGFVNNNVEKCVINDGNAVSDGIIKSVVNVQ